MVAVEGSDHPFGKLVRGLVVLGVCAGFCLVEVVLKRSCLEFILLCHDVSGISSCKD